MEGLQRQLRALQLEVYGIPAKVRASIITVTMCGLLCSLVIQIAIRLYFGPYAYGKPSIPAEPAPGNNSNSVHIGTAAAPEPANRKTYLTVEEVARQTGLQPRTVTDYCTTGRITPPPVKSARAWQIAADYRILPQSAALCGTAAGP